jgi:eukaryotic-like serine/threonine-protein kinase
VVAIAAIAVVTFLYTRRAPALSEKDSILLSDFVNTTGDSVFDGTLKQALVVQLGQSPFLNVVPESRIHEALKFMGRPADERITNEVAREICQREGIRAMLTGSIASLGSHYVINLTALNAQTGDSLATEQTEVTSKEAVLKALDSSATDLRRKLGESLASVQQFAKPLEQATTSSLDALKEFSLGQAEHSKLNDSAAIPHLQRALELDPNFAMADATLGVAYGNLTQSELADQYFKKGFDLKDRASEREKFYIAAHYYESIGDIGKAIDTYEQWKQIYPRDSVPVDNLEIRYSLVGQFEKALTNATAAMRLDPKDVFSYQNLSDIYERLDRYDEAQAVQDQAAANKIDANSFHFTQIELAFIRGDMAGVKREIEWATGKSDEPIVFDIGANIECALGKARNSEAAHERAVASAQHEGWMEFVGLIRDDAGVCDAEFGNLAAARQKAEQALAASQARTVRAYSAQNLARAGETAQAAKILDALAKEFPSATLLINVYIPVTKAVTLLHENKPDQAVAALQSAVPYELGSGPGGPGYWPNYIRGEAFLHMRDGARASAEYQKILSHHGVDPTSVLYPLSRLGLARAYVLQNDNAKARSAYQDFFAIWKDADPDVPVLKQAKAEYAKLQ